MKIREGGKGPVMPSGISCVDPARAAFGRDAQRGPSSEERESHAEHSP